jgi:SAM-dependent methyltransferase
MMGTRPIDYLRANVEAWQARQAEQLATARRRWTGEPCWGIFSVPESEARIFPDSVAGMDTLELGCGTAYVSAWLARLGAHPVGLDPTPGQLANAFRLQREFDLAFPLVRAAAEDVPLRNGSFDLIISEYGAAIWSDPYRGYPKPPAFCAGAESWSSSATARFSCCAFPTWRGRRRDESSRARSAACTVSSGRMIRRWNST